MTRKWEKNLQRFFAVEFNRDGAYAIFFKVFIVNNLDLKHISANFGVRITELMQFLLTGVAELLY